MDEWIKQAVDTHIPSQAREGAHIKGYLPLHSNWLSYLSLNPGRSERQGLVQLESSGNFLKWVKPVSHFTSLHWVFPGLDRLQKGIRVCLVLAAGRTAPGTVYLPPESMPLPALGLPIFFNMPAITALFSVLSTISLSLLSQKGYKLSLVWRFLSLSYQDGLIFPSVFPPFFLPHRAPVPTNAMQ